MDNAREEPMLVPSESGRALVYLVDDDASVRRALTRLLHGAGYDVASFATAEEFLTAEHPVRPSCLVADLCMPGMDGLELQALLRAQGLELPIVFISGDADLKSGVEAMKGGAVDFLEKPISAGVLFESLEQAIASWRARRDETGQRSLLEDRVTRLTPREKEVFALVVSGLPNKQVGATLGAAEKTIKVHRARVMEKMEADSLADLVRMAERLGVAARPR
jgi:FixJ family two-component response regulator